MKRPLKPAPRAAADPARAQSPGDRHAQLRFTWRMLLVGLCTNVVGCVAHYVFIAPPRLGGAMARPIAPAETRLVELPQSPGKP